MSLEAVRACSYSMNEVIGATGKKISVWFISASGGTSTSTVGR